MVAEGLSDLESGKGDAGGMTNAQETPPQTVSQLSPRDVRSIMYGLMIVMMLAALDTTIVAPAMPTIGRELGNSEYVPWIATAYLLVSTALSPLYGKLADIKGRRVVIMFALVVFLIGAIACALAPTMLTLVLARALQGAGRAGKWRRDG